MGVRAEEDLCKCIVGVSHVFESSLLTLDHYSAGIWNVANNETLASAIMRGKTQ